MQLTSQYKAVTMGGLVVAAGLAFGACTETEYREVIVEVEKPLYEEIPPAAAGFVGYGTEDAVEVHFTVCGNCHVGLQSRWAGTDHADAWASLQSSDHAAEYCEGCHTVSELGNDAVGDVGWTSTADTRFYDVQCESCHGGSKGHVDDPDLLQPLASIAVSEDDGCGQCHQGGHHPFVEEWSNSSHANLSGYPKGRDDCGPCHRGQLALEGFGVTSDYKEKDGPGMDLVCAVCHDPHSAHNSGQLRVTIHTQSTAQHLCSRCHDRRSEPDPGSTHGLGPHSPESGLIDGQAGWIAPGMTTDKIRGTHSSAANEKLCATCHVNTYTTTDENGDVFHSTGHRFVAIPCVDSFGVPVDGPCAVTTTARSFSGCTGGGCHGDETAAWSALTSAGADIIDEVEDAISQLEQVDPNLDLPGGEIDAADGVITTAEGLFFNVNLAIFPDGIHDGHAPAVIDLDMVAGTTTHNPFLLRTLLTASINAVGQVYGKWPAGSVAADWQAKMDELEYR